MMKTEIKNSEDWKEYINELKTTELHDQNRKYNISIKNLLKKTKNFDITLSSEIEINENMETNFNIKIYSSKLYSYNVHNEVLICDNDFNPIGAFNKDIYIPSFFVYITTNIYTLNKTDFDFSECYSKKCYFIFCIREILSYFSYSNFLCGKAVTIKFKPSANSKSSVNPLPSKNVFSSKWSDFLAEVFNPQSSKDGKKLSDFTLNDTSDIVVPNKMEIYKELDITEKDNVFVNFINNFAKGKNISRSVLLCNGDNNPVGVFSIVDYIYNGKPVSYLIAKSSDIEFKDYKSVLYYFIFTDMKKNNNVFYKVPIEVSMINTETTSSHLCIDFGTSNTTAGCFLDNYYIENISNLAQRNSLFRLDDINIVQFPSKSEKNDELDKYILSYSRIVPTIVYVEECLQDDEAKFLFGFEASDRVKKEEYCPKAACFMEIKRWTTDIDKKEEVRDLKGKRAKISRRVIIKEFLKYIINEAEHQFKCKFKNIHISAPVKLKSKNLEIYSEIIKSLGRNLETEHSIDEGISVLYTIIHNDINSKNSSDNSRKILIMDCGGGTSDLASCTYQIKKEDDIKDIEIKTEYMNGDVNFGGNNLTFRIMQYMKIAYAKKYNSDIRINIDDIITPDVNNIFYFIENGYETNETKTEVYKNYDDIYRKLQDEYEKAEEIIPTKFKIYENDTADNYNKIKNNFFFLWKLAEEMKKKFYNSTSISRYTFDSAAARKDNDLHINIIPSWKLSVKDNKTGEFKEISYPDIVFTAKEIDKLLRADIYYIVRKFLNNLYEDETLNQYDSIRLSGQSSKINIFMDAFKEFLPGRKIKSSVTSQASGREAEELKLLCLKGAILYMNSLKKSNIEVQLYNLTQNIPVSVYIKNEDGTKKMLIDKEKGWGQTPVERRISDTGNEIDIYIEVDNQEARKPYKYVFKKTGYKKVSYEEIKSKTENRITQNITDRLTANKKYILVYLNKKDWGFNILQIYRDSASNLYINDIEFVPFETDILQKSFFNGMI